MKWDLRTNEAERVCHARMLFDKITVLLQQLPAAKRGSSALEYPAPSPLAVFTWFSTLNGQSQLSKRMGGKKKKKKKKRGKGKRS